MDSESPRFPATGEEAFQRIAEQVFKMTPDEVQQWLNEHTTPIPTPFGELIVIPHPLFQP